MKLMWQLLTSDLKDKTFVCLFVVTDRQAVCKAKSWTVTLRVFETLCDIKCYVSLGD